MHPTRGVVWSRYLDTRAATFSQRPAAPRPDAQQLAAPARLISHGHHRHHGHVAPELPSPARQTHPILLEGSVEMVRNSYCICRRSLRTEGVLAVPVEMVGNSNTAHTMRAKRSTVVHARCFSRTMVSQIYGILRAVEFSIIMPYRRKGESCGKTGLRLWVRDTGKLGCLSRHWGIAPNSL